MTEASWADISGTETASANVNNISSSFWTQSEVLHPLENVGTSLSSGEGMRRHLPVLQGNFGSKGGMSVPSTDLSGKQTLLQGSASGADGTHGGSWVSHAQSVPLGSLAISLLPTDTFLWSSSDPGDLSQRALMLPDEASYSGRLGLVSLKTITSTAKSCRCLRSGHAVQCFSH